MTMKDLNIFDPMCLIANDYDDFDFHLLTKAEIEDYIHNLESQDIGKFEIIGSMRDTKENNFKQE